ncbi:condensation domain-containing protein [Streptomyces sp. ST2-7A]|uniref:condensation domain-containing protein n=1 Tax=Streptomyces sp. ST2-7A TaxID=2907214 RepID=UPI001F359F84|nr:condensation domain-containing protein [Streptomyces sp. ST2-7A]MCE7079514.1 condensation domain-containing protein [Streptomyces sp. ST2-7A]
MPPTPPSTAVPPGTDTRVPLSFNQEFLRSFDRGLEDGAFGHRHTLVGAWRIRGGVEVGRLQGALDKVVRRHEALRTEIVADGEGGYQRVLAATAVTLEVTELDVAVDRDTTAEEFLNSVDAAPFPVTDRPHLRAFVGRFTADDAVLVLATHHTSTDAWSLQVIARDLFAAYADDGGATDPEPSMQYREFALLQQESGATDTVRRARAYWQSRLDKAVITGLPTDRPHDESLPSDYGVERFALGKELSHDVTARARAVRGTPFMVLAAAYVILLRERTGTRSVVFPTFSAGRWEERFADCVGPFFNFVPVSVDTTHCTTHGDVLKGARTACLGAYQHEIPFAHIARDNPGLLAPFADPGRAVAAFEMLHAPFAAGNETGDGWEVTEMRRRTISQRVSSAIPNGALWALDLLDDGEIVGSLKFDHNRYDTSTVAGLITDFRRHLGALVRTPDEELPA